MRRLRRFTPPIGHHARARRRVMGKGILLWLIGIPLPLILILWLIFR